MARPTKLTQELLEIARAYPNNFIDHEHPMPSAVGLARVLRIHRSTLYDWAEKSKEFSDILEDINTQQELELLNKGITGVFNSQITKLALGKHGYHDKQELGGFEGEDITFKVKHV
jgi:hypothetical protein